jgi:hypothetical protein
MFFQVFSFVEGDPQFDAITWPAGTGRIGKNPFYMLIPFEAENPNNAVLDAKFRSSNIGIPGAVIALQQLTQAPLKFGFAMSDLKGMPLPNYTYSDKVTAAIGGATLMFNPMSPEPGIINSKAATREIEVWCAFAVNDDPAVTVWNSTFKLIIGEELQLLQKKYNEPKVGIPEAFRAITGVCGSNQSELAARSRALCTL